MLKEHIEVPKVLFGRYKKKKNNLIKLENSVIKTAWRYNQYGFIDPTEEEFIEKNKGKNVTLQLTNNSDVSGVLKAVDKYRISIVVGDEVKYYYKHAVISYYCVD